MKTFIKKFIKKSTKIFLLFMLRIVFALLEGLDILWAWIIASIATWQYRILLFSVTVFSLLLAFFGAQMMRQSFNATDSATICVVFAIGLSIVLMAIVFMIKFMPRKKQDIYLPSR